MFNYDFKSLHWGLPVGMMHVAMYLVLSTQLAVGTHVWVRRTKFSLNFRSGRSQPEVFGQCRTFCGSTSNFLRPLHRTFRRKRSFSTPFESLWRMTPSCSSKFSASCTKVRLQIMNLWPAIRYMSLLLQVQLSIRESDLHYFSQRIHKIFKN